MKFNYFTFTFLFINYTFFNINISHALFAVAKQGKSLGAYKLARYAFDKLQVQFFISQKHTVLDVKYILRLMCANIAIYALLFPSRLYVYPTGIRNLLT